MSTESFSRAMISKGQTPSQPWDEAPRVIPRLKALAVNGLLRMFDPEKQLFCYRLKHTEQGLVQEGHSRRYTMIALLGLHQLEANGIASPIRIKRVLDVLLRNTGWVDNIGDLGLLLWLCALEAPERQAEIEYCFQVESALERFSDAKQGSTLSLAWFLSGLSHLNLSLSDKRLDLRDVALQTYRRLRNNQGQLGIFGHMERTASIGGLLRGRIGSFADQVYPIYAMAKFAQAYQLPRATESALDCALTLCQAQGPLGQWWWHYDSWNGRVVERYPVYSVHQDGMAPMALFALGEVTHSNFDPWIYRGLQWITGNNEMDFEMPDVTGHVVWRGISRHPSRRYWNLAVACLTQREERGPLGSLKIQFECRPYHFGWLLYALAGRNDQSPSNLLGFPQETTNL